MTAISNYAKSPTTCMPIVAAARIADCYPAARCTIRAILQYHNGTGTGTDTDKPICLQSRNKLIYKPHLLQNVWQQPSVANSEFLTCSMHAKRNAILAPLLCLCRFRSNGYAIPKMACSTVSSRSGSSTYRNDSFITAVVTSHAAKNDFKPHYKTGIVSLFTTTPSWGSYSLTAGLSTINRARWKGRISVPDRHATDSRRSRGGCECRQWKAGRVPA